MYAPNLEGKLYTYSVDAFPQQHYPQHSTPQSTYTATSYYSTPIVEEQPLHFLNRSRRVPSFVDDAHELEESIRTTFQLTMHEELPHDIIISVAPRDRLLREHLSFLNPGVMGISYHETRRIFVAAGPIDEVLLTIGHEIGHVLTEPAATPQQEEAKAFAFEAAWAETLWQHDIQGLRESINSKSFLPAKNGIHDVGKAIVVEKTRELTPMQTFMQLSGRDVTVSTLAPTYAPLTKPIRLYGGYLNKSRVQNFAPPHPFFWDALPKSIYGMYVPLTKIETLNNTLKKDIEQMHKTQGHEYLHHHGLPDGYVIEALENAMFWTSNKTDNYWPPKQ